MAMLHELEHLPKHITNYIQQPPKCPLLTQSGHRRLRIIAVRTDPEPHFVDRKSLL